MKYRIIFLSIPLALTHLPNNGLDFKPQKISLISQQNKKEFSGHIIPEKYLDLVFRESGRCGVPLNILTSLIYNESSFNPRAVNRNKNGTIDQGLMQLNSANYAEFKWRFNNFNEYDPYDEPTNIRIGCMYLKWIYNNSKIGKGSWYRTLVFWNGSKESSKVFAKKVLG